MTSRAPRMDDEWSRLWTVAAKLTSDEQIDQRDRVWLCELLKEIGTDQDVRDRFFRTDSGRPRDDDRHFWMAADLKRRKHDGDLDAYASVGARWGMEPESVKRTLSRKSFDDVPLLPAVVIDWHRHR